MFTAFKFVPFNITGLLDCDKTRFTSLYLVKLRQQEMHMKTFTLKCGDKLAVTVLNRYEITDLSLETKSCVY